jgi:hypothetical protein
MERDMTEHRIEYAGGGDLQAVMESRAAAVAAAPAWVRNGSKPASRPASRPARASARPSAPPAAARRIAGWLAGCTCPGVSVPAYSKRDGQKLPEQFTADAVAGFVEQWTSGEEIRLTWKHGGPVLARSRFDICLRSNSITGLEFTCRLEDSDLARLALEQLTAPGGVAVSIGYHSRTARQWLVERDGIGTVRVVDRARLDHIALIPSTSGLSPAYRGARAFGIRGARVGCPLEIRDRARLYAYELVKRQAFDLLAAKEAAR